MNILKKFDHIPHIETLLALNTATKAFIFDMDGTIFQSEPIHALALQKLGESIKFSRP